MDILKPFLLTLLFALSLALSAAETININTADQEMLMSIKGIGEKRKRDLIRHFGSVRAIRQATVEQIAAVVGPKMAQKVVDYLIEHPDVRYKDEAVH